ncbi:2OG-Fe(II) oxygenase [Hymenobacter metallilatus]|uniref:Oxidoreductase, 2OG-Fe(II) oxygenase n=1 Tax=Hymenobacter metallilatus TaxID=2493666 RepID=A0A428JGW1_9BACT|nr:2OG-Fe(II) oxygenase [Hymenobacter metallilatus]RSK31799.1 oxidoreductase, 2OG-Fe(II) oxygenase [Hymenobacter metallilatus]
MQLTRITDSIFTIEDFLTRKECLDYLVLSENIGYELATVNTASGSRVHIGVRNNNRAFYKNEDMAHALWAKAQPFLPAQLGNSQAVGLNELFRFYRYQRGHQFKGHFDESYIRNETEASYYTFMIYLNDNFQGGDTTFQKLQIQPKQGMALVFLHNLYHAGSEVTQGVKYVLRTDVMYRIQEA